MRSYMIKISVGMAYEQNRPTGVAYALIAQIVFFFGEKCLKNSLCKFFFQIKVVTNRNTQLSVQNLF